MTETDELVVVIADMVRKLIPNTDMAAGTVLTVDPLTVRVDGVTGMYPRRMLVAPPWCDELAEGDRVELAPVDGGDRYMIVAREYTEGSI